MGAEGAEGAEDVEGVEGDKSTACGQTMFADRRSEHAHSSAKQSKRTWGQALLFHVNARFEIDPIVRSCGAHLFKEIDAGLGLSALRQSGRLIADVGHVTVVALVPSVSIYSLRQSGLQFLSHIASCCCNYFLS